MLSSGNVPSGRETNSLDFATALFDTFVVLQNRVDTYVASVRRTHNTLIPLHQIPIEIFTDILQLSLIREGPRIRKLSQYTSVASSWSALITSTPSLWSVITRHDSPVAITKAISKSKSFPLHIHTSCLGGEHESEDSMDHTILEPPPSPIPGVWNNVERWRWIDLTVDWQSVDEVKSLALYEAPLLEFLRLTIKPPYHPSNNKHRPYQYIELFAGVADRLRLLHLEGIGNPLESPLLQGIEDLELHDVWFTSSKLMTLVRKSHRLRRLVVDGVLGETSDSLGDALVAVDC